MWRGGKVDWRKCGEAEKRRGEEAGKWRGGKKEKKEKRKVKNIREVEK